MPITLVFRTSITFLNLCSFPLQQVEIDWPKNTSNRIPSAISPDTILLSRQSVEDVNKVVLKRDKSNFQIIEAIIDFRKGIYQDIWANKALSMRIFNGIEKIKDLHLTRTTRVIQEFLKSGEDKSIREAAEVESQIKRNRYMPLFPLFLTRTRLLNTHTHTHIYIYFLL